MDNRHRSIPRCPFHHKEAVHVPGIAAVRTGPGRPTGIGVPTFSAGWEGEGVVGAKAPEQYTTVCSLSQTCTPPHTPHAHPHTPHMHTPTAHSQQEHRPTSGTPWAAISFWSEGSPILAPQNRAKGSLQGKGTQLINGSACSLSPSCSSLNIHCTDTWGSTLPRE